MAKSGEFEVLTAGRRPKVGTANACPDHGLRCALDRAMTMASACGTGSSYPAVASHACLAAYLKRATDKGMIAIIESWTLR
jgi:L-lactate dehydrogenase